MASQKADKAASALPPPGNEQQQPPPLDRETDEFILNYLRTRVRWGRVLTYVEAELEGRAQELQAIQHYSSTAARCSRPRKRARVEDDDNVESPVDGTVNAAATAALEETLPSLDMNLESTPDAATTNPTTSAQSHPTTG